MIWGPVSLNNNTTYTFLSKFQCTVLTVGNSSTTILTGIAGFECDTFNFGVTVNTGRNLTLEAGVEYKVNTNFNSIRSTNSNRAVLQSSSGVNNAIFTCGPSCNMAVGYTNAIRIDSSLGKQVYSFNGVYTTAVNWGNSFPVSISYAYQE
jgi:hypothetical protein